jgi:hypothetical protein
MDLGGGGMTSVAAPVRVVESSPIAQWRRRVLRVSSLCQIGFGTVWLANAVRAHAPNVSPVLLAVGLVGFGAAIAATRGSAPRPSGREARSLERNVTIATVVQLVASFVLPVVLIVSGHSWLVMPVVVVSIGALFVYLYRLLQVPRLGALGAALIVIPIAAIAALSGSAQTAVMLGVAGSLMVANGSAGVRSLARRSR